MTSEVSVWLLWDEILVDVLPQNSAQERAILVQIIFHQCLHFTADSVKEVQIRSLTLNVEWS